MKRVRTQVINPYNRSPQRIQETSSTSELSKLNASKTKNSYDNAIYKYNKFAKLQFPPVPEYKDLTKKHLQSKEVNLGLRTILSNFAMFLLEQKQENGKEYAPGSILQFLSNFKTVICKNTKF